MCGIAGIISSDPSLVTQQRLTRMTDALAHRGPNGAFRWINPAGTTGLAHRRLAIIDLSDAAAQPMHVLNRYTIVHNGELYNYQELQHSLQQKGYVFNTQSDTEVIVAAFDHYGTDCLQQFDGMFAFAIWDEQEQLLFAARDRFGEKPFYYFPHQQQFLFASEMKALWAAGAPSLLREDMLFNYLTLGYVQHPEDAYATFYKGIDKLPARHFLIFQPASSSLSIQQYWDIDHRYINTSLQPAAAIEQFRELFHTSVNRRLRSDVPLGTSLSGGLDSSSVLASMRESLGNGDKLHTFSAVFKNFHHDESPQIKLVSEALEARNYTVQPSAADLLDDLEKIVYHQEEPFQSSSLLAQYKVYQLAARQGITVLLDGQGADEILAGYTKYYHWFWQELFRFNKAALPAERKAAQELGIAEGWTWRNRLAAYFPDAAARFLGSRYKSRQRQHPDLHPEFIRAYGQSHYYLPATTRLNGVLYYNSFQNGLEELLQYADRNSMAHGREVRLPFLNHELVEFIFSLPAQYKIHQGWSKWLLRKSMEPLLPQSIVWRKEKVGFETPQQQWMQEKKVQERILAAKKILVEKNILRPSVLHKKIQPQENHAADNFDWRYLVAGTLLR